MAETKTLTWDGLLASTAVARDALWEATGKPAPRKRRGRPRSEAKRALLLQVFRDKLAQTPPVFVEKDGRRCLTYKGRKTRAKPLVLDISREELLELLGVREAPRPGA